MKKNERDLSDEVTMDSLIYGYQNYQASQEDLVIEGNGLDAFIRRNGLIINYIPGNSSMHCTRVLVININNNAVANLICGINHVEACKNVNKEVILELDKLDDEVCIKCLREWAIEFINRGVGRVTVLTTNSIMSKEFIIVSR